MKKKIPKDANLIPETARQVFKGEIFEVWQWPQKMYDGSTATFEMLKRPDTVVILAIKDGKLVILNQSQPNLKNEFLDFPGGRADEGELPLEAAKRELLEETGMTFQYWRLLDVFQPLQKLEWFINIYLATGFISQTDTKHDAGEMIKILSMTLDEIKNFSDDKVRFNKELLKRYNSIDELTEAQEYSGVEIDIKGNT